MKKKIVISNRKHGEQQTVRERVRERERGLMDSMARDAKPHAVCMPVPAQGHINAMLQLAKLLHFRGFHITFVLTQQNFNRILATCGPSSLEGLSDFRIEAISDGLKSSDPTSGEEAYTLCSVVRDNLPEPFRQLLKRLNESDGPKVSCVVSDIFTSFTLEIAAELGIPHVSFCSMSACGFWGFFAFKELVEQGIVPLKSESYLNNGYLDTLIDWIPGKKMRLRDFPSFVRTTNPNDELFNYCKDEVQEARKATAIIINTFDQLEGPVLDAMKAKLPPVYAVGPLHLLCRQINNDRVKSIGFNLWNNDSSCLEWLGRKTQGSVLYVNFGSQAVMTNQQLVEFAWGLANSGYNFLWVIRPNIVTGDSAILPKDFLSEIGKRGLLTSWCPQEEVLMHPSIGVFLTHNGWNSTMESIGSGIPMICWPYFVDQQTNCCYVCSEWGIGLRIIDDVKRDEVERLIRDLMDGEKGKEMRRMALKWKESAITTIKPHGKSSLNLERVIKEVLFQKENCI